MDRFGITKQIEVLNQGDDDGSNSDASSEPAFVTPPPPPMSKYKTPITNTQRRRGSNYIYIRACRCEGYYTDGVTYNREGQAGHYSNSSQREACTRAIIGHNYSRRGL